MDWHLWIFLARTLPVFHSLHSVLVFSCFEGVRAMSLLCHSPRLHRHSGPGLPCSSPGQPPCSPASVGQSFSNCGTQEVSKILFYFLRYNYLKYTYIKKFTTRSLKLSLNEVLSFLKKRHILFYIRQQTNLLGSLTRS